MLWLARDGTSDEQYAAYDRLICRVKLPEKKSTVMVGDEPDKVEPEEMIAGLPLGKRYVEAAAAAARRRGFESPTFVLAVLFREMSDAPSSAPEEGPLQFIGRFEFPFPERGDPVGGDDQEWLGIDASYCLGEDTAPEQGDPDRPWWKFWK